MKFNFGSLVMVEGSLVGVVVKCWVSNKTGNNYDIYVRSYNDIQNYKEEEVSHLIIDKELSKEQLEYF